MRADASELLKQEQGAALPKIEHPAPPPPTAEQKKKSDAMVQSLETFRGDIEKLMRSGDVSAVSIASAQARQNQQDAERVSEIKKVSTTPDRSRAMLLYGTGGALFLCAVGIVSYVLFRPTTVAVQTPAAAPFILVDDTAEVQIAPNETRGDVIAALTDVKAKTALSLGLVGRIEPVAAATTTNTSATPTGAQPLLDLLAPDIPDALLRNIEPTFLLGVHSFDTNQPFLILKIDSYEQAFAGMLAWEPTMHQDLSPLFDYTPSPHINTDTAAVVTNDASSTDTADNNTNSATPFNTAVAQPPGFMQTIFVDTVVENHDARALKNSAGDVYFLWTFLDRNTLLITTNPYTVREVINRLKNAPVLYIPGQ